MAAALTRARRRSGCRLAAAAGLANDEEPCGRPCGRQIERGTRGCSRRKSAEAALATATTDVAPHVDGDVTPSLVDRIRAVLAA